MYYKELVIKHSQFNTDASVWPTAANKVNSKKTGFMMSVTGSYSDLPGLDK